MSHGSLCIESAVRGTDTRSQDRIAIVPLGDGQLLILSDGAGAIAGGRQAAEAVVRFFRQRGAEFLALDGCYGWALALSEADRLLTENPTAGEATAVVVFIAKRVVCGASVGNSRAWLITADGIENLTERQRDLPLIGSGRAVPVGFGPVALSGRLLLASDGLFDYAEPDEIVRAARTEPIADAPARLIESARPASGGLTHDVAVIVCGCSEVVSKVAT
jgi:PPM family protein phosphatase